MTAQQKNKEITISVIVPVHNVEAYLNECLSSLLFQSLESAEFIVIDDGSTDKSGQFVMNLRRKILVSKLFIRRTREPSLPVKQLLLLPKENGASA